MVTEKPLCNAPITSGYAAFTSGRLIPVWASHLWWPIRARTASIGFPWRATHQPTRRWLLGSRDQSQRGSSQKANRDTMSRRSTSKSSASSSGGRSFLAALHCLMTCRWRNERHSPRTSLTSNARLLRPSGNFAVTAKPAQCAYGESGKLPRRSLRCMP